MKFAVERKKLSEALAALGRVVEARTTIPILSNTKIEVKNKTLVLTETNLDIECRVEVTTDYGTDGAVTVPAHMLRNIVAKLSDGALVTAEARSVSMKIEAGRSKFNIQTLPASDFPALTDFIANEQRHTFELAGDVLARCISDTQFVISTEETRYYLNGVFLHVADGGDMRFVATDGHRLAKVTVAAPEGAAGMEGIIIPRQTVAEIMRIARSAGADAVKIEASKSKIKVTHGATSLVSKLVDGTYPDYMRVIPKSSTINPIADVLELAAAVDRASSVSTTKSRAIKLDFDAGCLSLTVADPDGGIAVDTVDIQYQGAGASIGFNVRYLLDILKICDKGTVSINFEDSSSPTVFKPASKENLLMVLMPMRV